MDITDNDPTRYLHRGMAALDLVNAFADELRADASDEERERLVGTILCAGQHVFEISGPGHWEAFDAPAFDHEMPCDDERERRALFFDLTSFFGWMAMNCLMAPAATSKILRELERIGPPCPARQDLARVTISLLDGLEN